MNVTRQRNHQINLFYNVKDDNPADNNGYNDDTIMMVHNLHC